MENDFRKKEKNGGFCSCPDRPGNGKGADAVRGKILRVKQGYNPNSSSMGSIIFVLPAVLLGITAVFGAVSGIIFSVFMKGAGQKGIKKEGASSRTPDMEKPSD